MRQVGVDEGGEGLAQGGEVGAGDVEVAALGGRGGLACIPVARHAPDAVAVNEAGVLFVADTHNHRVLRVEGAAPTVVLGTGAPSSAGEGAPAAAFPVDLPSGLAFDRFGNLFVATRQSVRRVTANEDGEVFGDAYVSTVVGAEPRTTFPEDAIGCLGGVAVEDDDTPRSREPEG